MSRPKENADQQHVALGLWGKGLSIRAAHRELQALFNEPVSHGTVGNWFKRFNEGDTAHGDADRSYRWAEMTGHGIPSEAGSVINKIVIAIRELTVDQHAFVPWQGEISFRHAKWIWRVYNAVEGIVDFMPLEVKPIPDTDGRTSMWLGKLIYVSRVFSEAERARLLSGTTVDTSYYEGELMYRPWESEENQDRHEQAIRDGMATADDIDSFYCMHGALATSNEIIGRRKNLSNRRKEN
jgi:hypothetical protein